MYTAKKFQRPRAKQVKRSHLDAQKMKALARGHWPEIFQALAPSLNSALDQLGRHIPCPVHGGKNGFRLFKDVAETGGGICNTCGSFPDGLSLLQWVNGWEFKQALEAVASCLGLHTGKVVPMRSKPLKTTPRDKSKERKDAFGRRERLVNVWGQSNEIRHGDPVHTYLAERIPGLDVVKLPSVKRVLRYHPRLPYWDGSVQPLGLYPAMVAAVQDSNSWVVSLHRTYLIKEKQKAPVPDPKKLMSPVMPGGTRGAAIRLFPVAETLNLTEGIETALAVHIDTGLPVWACICACGLETVKLPSLVRKIIICGDNDKNCRGQKAAERLARRLIREGKKVKVVIPDRPSTDRLDEYNREALA